MTRVKKKHTLLAVFLGTALPRFIGFAEGPTGAVAYSDEYEKLADKLISALVAVESASLALTGLFIVLMLCQYLPARGNMAKTESAKNLFILAMVSAGVALLAAVLKIALPLVPGAISPR